MVFRFKARQIRILDDKGNVLCYVVLIFVIRDDTIFCRYFIVPRATLIQEFVP